MKLTVLLLATISGCVACPVGNPECGGELGGFMKNGGDPSNCSYVHIQKDGQVYASQTLFTGCADRNGGGNGIPMTSKNNDDHLLYFMTGAGTSLFSVAYGSGEQAVAATLPKEYNFTVGLEYISGNGIYMLTTSTLYVIPPGKTTAEFVLDVSQLRITEDGVMTASANHKMLFVTDGKALHKFDVSSSLSAPKVETVKMKTLSKAMDLAVYAPQGEIESLIVLESYKLYSLDYKTGVSSFLLDIPDGPGFPRINDIFTDTFYFCDFDNLFAIDIPSKTVLYNATFDGALLQGYFQFHN